MAATTELFVELCSGVQGFPVTENKYAEGRGQRRTGEPAPYLGAGPGLAAPRGGVAPLCLPFGLRLRLVKLGTSQFVSSNSENISCATFLKPKTAENWN